jgi:hypothetical protein
MAKFLLLLLLPLLSLLRTSDALAQSCYCTYPYGDGRCYANTQCWACAPGAYDTNWQSNYCTGYTAPAPVVTCTSTFAERTESCPVNYTGVKKYKQETKTCSDGQVTSYGWELYADTCTPNPVTCTYSAQLDTRACPANFSGSQTWKKETNCPSGSYGQPVYTDWFKIQDTCTPNPPTCQVTTESQSLACPTGYTGAIMQMRTSTCPNPYGQPVMGPWTTTTNTCAKSVTNPTNISSPVSPVSPLNPNSVVSPTATAVTTPVPTVSAPQQMQTPQDVSAPPVEAPAATESKESEPQSQTSTATSAAPTAASSAPQTSAKGGAKETPKNAGKPKLSIGGLNPAMSLEFFVKPGIIQPNVFPTLNIGADLPEDIRQNHQFLMELLSGHLPDQSGMFNKMARDAIELEQ